SEGSMISGDFIKLRISGEMMAVEKMAERLHFLVDVRDDSLNFPNHEGPGVYRYLMVLLQDREEMSGGRRAPVPLRAVRGISSGRGVSGC
ncbi:MAG: hypothetical protein ACREN8_06845, partial [Candidatus Dormibacteraceae bacterium]